MCELVLYFFTKILPYFKSQVPYRPSTMPSFHEKPNFEKKISLISIKICWLFEILTCLILSALLSQKYLISSTLPAYHAFLSQIKTKLWKKNQPYLHKNPLNFWNSDMFELVFFAIITLQIFVSLLFSSVTVTFVMTKTLLKHCKSQAKNRHC